VASYRALVIGATGAVGGALVRELIASPSCTAVVALSRRPFDAAQSLGRGLSTGISKVVVHVVPFETLEARTAELGAGCDAAFCTMGIGQPRKTSFEDFRRVDVDYTGAFARGAAAAGARHISLLSSVGAHAASRNPYLRVKGEAEQAVAAAGIPRTSLFRPSLLVTPEIRYGLQDRVTQALFPLIAPILPSRYHHIRIEDLGRAMRVNAERPGAPGTEILEYGEFIQLLRAS
jgi:uncharacterized protein YbjT (DUF2867 family)